MRNKIFSDTLFFETYLNFLFYKIISHSLSIVTNIPFNEINYILSLKDLSRTVSSIIIK